jgi:hypothetical protein
MVGPELKGITNSLEPLGGYRGLFGRDIHSLSRKHLIISLKGSFSVPFPPTSTWEIGGKMTKRVEILYFDRVFHGSVTLPR